MVASSECLEASGVRWIDGLCVVADDVGIWGVCYPGCCVPCHFGAEMSDPSGCMLSLGQRLVSSGYLEVWCGFIGQHCSFCNPQDWTISIRNFPDPSTNANCSLFSTAPE